MAAEGRPFKGVLYAGLMITADGPQLLEYNVRFGDPECQVLMARLRSDIVPALMAAHDGELDRFDLRWRDEAALCVVMAVERLSRCDTRKGSADPWSRGVGSRKKIAGDLVVFPRRYTACSDDHYLATGGRVLGVSPRSVATVEAAQAQRVPSG